MNERFVITERGIVKSNDFDASDFGRENVVYEVIRIIDGIPLFCEDHFERLQRSAWLKGYNLPLSFEKFEKELKELALGNNKQNGNVKFVYREINCFVEWAYFFIPHHYPALIDYKSGVMVGLLEAERTDPNAKVVQPDVRQKADERIRERNLFEVLLVDKSGAVTEGSRSNVFFIKSGCFYMPPAEKILEGITRSKVIDCIAEMGMQLVETDIFVSELASFEAAFLTGTSPKVLPISRIDELHFQPANKILKQLMEVYDQKMTVYIQSHK